MVPSFLRRESVLVVLSSIYAVRDDKLETPLAMLGMPLPSGFKAMLADPQLQ